MAKYINKKKTSEIYKRLFFFKSSATRKPQQPGGNALVLKSALNNPVYSSFLKKKTIFFLYKIYICLFC